MPGTDYDKWAQFEKELPEDEEESALRKLKEQKANMSEEEVRRLHNCWEQPEFKAMFHEYAEEVSDPAHKAEQEAYLAQVEAEQRAERDAKNGFLNGRSAASMGIHSIGEEGIGGGPPGHDPVGNYVPGQPDGPEGSQLLKPLDGFVLKTWSRNPGRKDYDREMGKVFVNIVHHEDIDPPKATDVTAPDGRRGQSWSMPHLCSPKVKEETDKSGHKCTVIDICFHSEVIKRIEAPNGMGERWKQMVAKTAVEMVGKLHQLDLDPEYKLLKMKYYGPEGVEGPSTMSWKPAKAFEDVAETATGTSGGGVAAAPSPATTAPKASSKPAAPKAATAAPSPPAASAAAPSPPPPPSKPSASPEQAAAAAAAAAKATKEQAAEAAAKFTRLPTQKQWRAPQHTIVHRGVGDAMGMAAASWSDDRLRSSGRPRELCIKVELPELTSAADIDLDITERQLKLEHEGASYRLELKLPYAVLSDQGSAKFDKAKRVLSVTVPVDGAAAPMEQWKPPTAAADGADAEAEAEKAAEKAAKAKAAEDADARRAAEREARSARLAQEEAERQARIRQAQAQADKEAQRRSRGLAPTAPPARPPPSAPTVGPGGVAPKDEWVVMDDAEAAEARAASPPAAAAKERAAAKQEAASKMASAPPAKAPAPAPSPAPKPAKAQAEAVPPLAPAPTPPPPAAPPAPTGQDESTGLPALSNDLLYELD